MNKKKIIFISVSILLLIIAALLIRQNYLISNIDYQLEKLASGTTEQKLLAADILGEKKVLTAIPLLVKNIDNMNSSTYSNSHKAPESVSCSSTFALENITSIKLGNTCNINGNLSELEIGKVQKAWKNWYEDEYPKWLDQQEETK